MCSLTSGVCRRKENYRHMQTNGLREFLRLVALQMAGQSLLHGLAPDPAPRLLGSLTAIFLRASRTAATIPSAGGKARHLVCVCVHGVHGVIHTCRMHHRLRCSREGRRMPTSIVLGHQLRDEW